MVVETLVPEEYEVIGRLVYLLVVLAIGFGARVIGVLTARRVDYLTAIAFYVALPALVFSSTYGRSLLELLSAGLLVGLWAVLFATAGLAWLVHRVGNTSTARRSVAIVQSYHTSVGFLGLPLVAATFDGTTTAIASIILGIVLLTQVPLTVLLLVQLNDADASVRHELRQLARNPVLGALLAGLVVSVVGIDVPATADVGLGSLADLALPLALICVGASLPLDLPSVDLGATGSVVALKIGCMPFLAWIVFSLLQVGQTTFVAGVVMLAMPTAVSTFIYAGELGGDEEFASVNVLATIVVSVVTLFVLLQAVA